MFYTEQDDAHLLHGGPELPPELRAVVGDDEPGVAELLGHLAHQGRHVTGSWRATIDAQAQQPSGEAIQDRGHREASPENL